MGRIMTGATAESQVPVVVAALRAEGFNATPGVKRSAHRVVVRGSPSVDLVRAIAKRHAHGFYVHASEGVTYVVLTLEKV
jgi:hypothetical protein